MIRLLAAYVVYGWHRIRKHEMQRLVFQGHVMRLQCFTCGERIWQRSGLFSKR